MKSDNTIRSSELPDKTLWNKYVDHPLQSWEWGEFRKSMGIIVERIILNSESPKKSLFQVFFHPIPHTSFTVGYLPKGPKPTPKMVETLTNIGRKHNTIYVLMEPKIIPESFQIKDLTKFSIKPAHHEMFTKYTFILDLTQKEEDILAHMHPKTRYNIKVAQKHNVKINEDNSPRAFEQYLKLTGETTTRQKFYAHNNEYHQKMWENMRMTNQAHLWTAKLNDEVLAAWIIFTLNDTVYYPYGASAGIHREVMASNLLAWDVIKWSKNHGYKYFDMWGALGSQPDPRDPWFGFHRFKQGYGPKHVEYIGSYDLILQPFLYFIFCIADNIRWAILRFKKSILS